MIGTGMFYPLTITCYGCPADASKCTSVTNGFMTSYMILAAGVSVIGAAGIVYVVQGKTDSYEKL